MPGAPSFSSGLRVSISGASILTHSASPTSTRFTLLLDADQPARRPVSVVRRTRDTTFSERAKDLLASWVEHEATPLSDTLACSFISGWPVNNQFSPCRASITPYRKSCCHPTSLQTSYRLVSPTSFKNYFKSLTGCRDSESECQYGHPCWGKRSLRV